MRERVSSYDYLRLGPALVVIEAFEQKCQEARREARKARPPTKLKSFRLSASAIKALATIKYGLDSERYRQSGIWRGLRSEADIIADALEFYLEAARAALEAKAPLWPGEKADPPAPPEVIAAYEAVWEAEKVRRARGNGGFTARMLTNIRARHLRLL